MKIRFTLLIALCGFGFGAAAQCWQSMDGGTGHTLALISDGTLWACGNNVYGQLGDGTNFHKNSPNQIGTATNWQSVAAGNHHSLAIKTGRTLWAWGDNFFGQLGDGTNVDKNSPAQIGTATDWQSVVAGTFHSFAIKADGTLWAWGRNSSGQLGDGTNVDKNIPTQIGTATDWQSVAAGGGFSLAIKADGTLWAWGVNSFGQLGDGTTVNKNSPTQIGTATDWQSVVAGGGYSLAIKTDGTLWAWGDNFYGQLGDGTTVEKNSPTQIGTATNWQSVAAGFFHSLAIKTDGTAWAWGGNEFGQLGDGTDDNKNSPTQIGTATDWQSVAVGSNHSFAIKADGNAWAWGVCSNGQLGDGTNVDKNTPTELACPVNIFPHDACGTANQIDSLLGGPLNTPMASGIFDNTSYNSTNDPSTGFECWVDGPLVSQTIWYSFTGDGNTYRIRSIECGATNYIFQGDTQVAIYSGSCGSLAPVACNDDEDANASFYNIQIDVPTQAGTTYWMMVDGFGTEVGQFCLEVTNLTASAVTNIERTNIGIFPNPTTGIVQFTNVKADQVQVFDGMGRLVFTKAQPGTSLDISGVPAGIYFLKITEGEAVYSAKVVKE